LNTRGSEQCRPNTALTRLAVVLVVSALFDLPLLAAEAGQCPRAFRRARYL
jgi:hypothetical protein